MSKELVGLGISVNVSICAAAGKRDGDHKENNGWRARDRKVYYTWQEVGMEGMSHTLEAMERNGIQICYQPTKAGEVESITFTVDGLSRYWNTGDSSISRWSGASADISAYIRRACPLRRNFRPAPGRGSRMNRPTASPSPTRRKLRS